MKSGIIIISALSAVFCACIRYADIPSENPGDGALWSVECNGFIEKGVGDVKSRFSDAGLEVKNFNVWVYDSSGSLANGLFSGYESYFDGITQVDGARMFPDAFAEYDVYVVANVGKILPRNIPSTKSKADSYRLALNYGDFASEGLPLALHRHLCPAFSDCLLRVVPLVSRYDISILNDSDTEYEFSLKSLVADNCASAVYPFKDESAAVSLLDVTSQGDCFVQEVDDFGNRKGTIYLLENVQGEVFEDASSRIPSAMKEGKGSYASYLKFEGSCRNKDDTGYETVICRYYFGEGTEAFAKRNVRTALTLRLTKGIFDNDGWTVEPDGWFNNGRVVFSPPSVTIASGQSAVVNVGTYDSSGSANGYVKYTLSYNASAFSNAKLRMEYKPSGSSVWRTYAAQQLQGQCSLRLGTSFLGQGSRTVAVTAIGTDGTTLSPTPLTLTAEGYPYPVSISLATTDFTNMSSSGSLEFDVAYSDGSARHIAGKDENLSLSKLNGKSRLDNTANGWTYRLVDVYCDCCTFKATYSETVGGTPVTVSSQCKFSVWALDAESADTRYNSFQDVNKSMTTSDHRNYYVSAKKISTSGTVFEMDSATLCLTDGNSSKVVSVSLQPSCSWTVTMQGQSIGGFFSVVNNGSAIRIRKSGNIVGANASFTVSMTSGYKDTEGHSSDAQSFSVTILE